MKHTVLLPLREDALIGRVVAWHREIGEYVPPDEPLLTLRFGEEDEPVTTGVPGVLFRKTALTGEAVEAGEPLAVLAGVVGPIPAAQETLSPYTAAGPEEIVVPSPAAQALARHYARTVRESPHVTSVTRADLSETLRLRDKAAAQAGQAIGLLPFFVAATAGALAQFPALNAQWLSDGEVRRKRYVHLALPMPIVADPGIAAPVVRDADQKSVLALAREIAALQAQAHADALPETARRGATFTLTDLTETGVLFQTPLLHLPQAAHLAVGAVAENAVHLCLAHDMRLADGWTAAAFLAEIRRSLEEARFLFV